LNKASFGKVDAAIAGIGLKLHPGVFIILIGCNRYLLSGKKNCPKMGKYQSLYRSVLL